MSAKFTLCLCLAGLGTRFSVEGYTTPKFLLPMADGHTSILREILTSFLGTEDAVGLLVFNKRYEDWSKHIQEAVSHLGYPVTIAFIEDTQGQAETAAAALEILEEHHPEMLNKPVFFHNGDTVLYGRNLSTFARKLRDVQGLIDSFDMDSPAYSYVRTNDADIVTEMKEKVVISHRATTGLYGFDSPHTYREFHKQAQANGWTKEFYISDVYRAMLDTGAPITNTHHDDDVLTLNLGTPSEYEAYLSLAKIAA